MKVGLNVSEILCMTLLFSSIRPDEPQLDLCFLTTDIQCSGKFFYISGSYLIGRVPDLLPDLDLDTFENCVPYQDLDTFFIQVPDRDLGTFFLYRAIPW